VKRTLKRESKDLEVADRESDCCWRWELFEKKKGRGGFLSLFWSQFFGRPSKSRPLGCLRVKKLILQLASGLYKPKILSPEIRKAHGLYGLLGSNSLKAGFFCFIEAPLGGRFPVSIKATRLEVNLLAHTRYKKLYIIIPVGMSLNMGIIIALVWSHPLAWLPHSRGSHIVERALPRNRSIMAPETDEITFFL